MGNELIKNIKYLWHCILNVIYSDGRECTICNEYVSDEKLLCNKCRAEVKLCKEYFKICEETFEVKCFSSAYYSGIIKELIINLKYKNDFKAGEVLVQYMVDTIRKQNIKFDVITYVPSTKKSIKKRGYNQSKYLARTISYKIDTKSLEFLVKFNNTKDQIGLNGEERWKNLKDSFKCINIKYLKNKRILLVDDVITTGATSFYCAKAMLRSGASEVIILTCAKSSL
ncbi:ComF family protein [Clostridium ganghwense]|uniref:ComF family protein n=1 Tax=Clostridium ganghwense TaxID=312089 RepID=A0ABT4CL76_9CLOT|nr:ComF family protein [Clostridium ganghwense]MCY6369801.1 ComF family protein [Clostridium ganghwense]